VCAERAIRQDDVIMLSDRLPNMLTRWRVSLCQFRLFVFCFTCCSWPEASYTRLMLLLSLLPPTSLAGWLRHHAVHSNIKRRVHQAVRAFTPLDGLSCGDRYLLARVPVPFVGNLHSFCCCCAELSLLQMLRILKANSRRSHSVIRGRTKEGSLFHACVRCCWDEQVSHATR
jgi:hypothetical protein